MSGDQRVGIGTGTPANALHVHSDAFDVLRLTSTNPAGPHISLDNGSNIAYVSFIKNDFDGDGSVRENAVEINNTGPGGKIHFISGGGNTGSPSMVIVPGGNVGIGTNVPGAKLDVNGIADFRETIRTRKALAPVVGWASLTQYDSKFLFYDNGGSNWSGMGVDTTGLWWVRTGTDAQHVMVMRADGNVGIGTDSPQQLLHVNGNLRVGPATLNTPEGSAPLLTARAFGTIIQSNDNGSASVLNGINISGVNFVNSYLEVYFATPMVNASYTVVVGPGWSSALNQPVYVNRVWNQTTTYFTMHVGAAHANGISWVMHYPTASGVTIAVFS